MKTLARSTYRDFLKTIKEHIIQSKSHAARNLNQELIRMNYSLGKMILENQSVNNWGDNVVERLSRDLCKKFGGSEGFSVQNLWYMRQFHLEYCEDKTLLSFALKVPWGHNILILSKVKKRSARAYYLKATIQMGWSRNILLNQIKGRAYERQLKSSKQHNFKSALPVHIAEQAEEALKSDYNLDFLGISSPVHERQLEAKMIEKIRQMILELGYGFSFIGNQFRIPLGRKNYYVDLLFFHRKLRCLVAIDLKIGEFEPE